MNNYERRKGDDLLPKSSRLRRTWKWTRVAQGYSDEELKKWTHFQISECTIAGWTLEAVQWSGRHGKPTYEADINYCGNHIASRKGFRSRLEAQIGAEKLLIDWIRTQSKVCGANPVDRGVGAETAGSIPVPSAPSTAAGQHAPETGAGSGALVNSDAGKPAAPSAPLAIIEQEVMRKTLLRSAHIATPSTSEFQRGYNSALSDATSKSPEVEISNEAHRLRCCEYESELTGIREHLLAAERELREQTEAADASAKLVDDLQRELVESRAVLAAGRKRR